MFALKCTRRFLARLDLKPAEEAAPSTTRLGDWCANVIPLGRREVALVVNVRSLLPVLVPLAPVDRFLAEFLRTVAEVLVRIGVTPAAIDSELCEMTSGRVEKTSSRQVLGSMTDFAFMAEASSRARDLVEVAMWLAESPCSPIGMRSPSDVARELLGGRARHEGLDS
jgi:hypothetical protein